MIRSIAFALLLGAALITTALGQGQQGQQGQPQGQQQQGQPQGQPQGQQQGQPPQGQQGGQPSQGSQKQDKQGGQAAGGATRKASPAGVVPLGITVEEKDLVVEGWRASKLLGASVYNDKNQRIGKIEDMIVSPDGKLSVAVVDVGGFLGMGKHRVAIPTDQFSDIHAKRLVLPGATKDALKQLPEFRFVA